MMRTRSWAILCVVLSATAAGVSACSSAGHADGGGLDDAGADDGDAGGSARASGGAGKDAGDAGSGGSSDAEAGAGGAGGEAGLGGAAGDDVVSTCVPTGANDSPDDDFVDSNCDGIDGDKKAAVFVSPDGNDENDGSFGLPTKTLRKGIALAAAQGKDLYVCTAEYPENLLVNMKPVNIFGGYDCVTWGRDNQRAKVSPPSGVALTLRGVSQVTIDRINFAAANATVPGTSSIAVRVITSDQVVLSHLDLVAGNGAAGTAGEPVQALPQAQAGHDGDNGDYCNPFLSDWPCDTPKPMGGDAPSTTCGSTKIHGGTGGRAAPYPTGNRQTGAVGTPGNKKSGAEGANGAAGTEGSISKETFGSVTNLTYVASNSGGDGTDGTPGESGGGGDGGYSCHHESFVLDDQMVADCVAGVGGDRFYFGSGGGQGGYGGCGGAAGHGGGGGGASIALLSIKSTVSLSWSSLTTGTGGPGGAPSNGAKGQAGGRGGKAGKPTTYASGSYLKTTSGQDGGPAGDGGPGGAGGPGGGGPSITLVALGEAPLTQAVTFANGAGGIGAVGFNGTDALSGESGEVKVVPVAPSE